MDLKMKTIHVFFSCGRSCNGDFLCFFYSLLKVCLFVFDVCECLFVYLLALVSVCIVCYLLFLVGFFFVMWVCIISSCIACFVLVDIFFKCCISIFFGLHLYTCVLKLTFDETIKNSPSLSLVFAVCIIMVSYSIEIGWYTLSLYKEEMNGM